MYIHVIGRPAPKGSPRISRRGGKIRVRKDSNKTELWHELVAHAARGAVTKDQRPLFVKTALFAEIEFRVRRPGGHFGKHGLMPSAPLYPGVKPDLDKLVRATLDPLEGVIFDNDSRIVRIDAWKLYSDGCQPGAKIKIVPAEAIP